MVHHPDRRSGGAAGERSFRKRISVHSGGILSRQHRAHCPENDRRVPGQTLRGGFDRRHGVADHGASRRPAAKIQLAAACRYPAELKDAQGFWGATNLYFFATGYNARMVKANEVPKTYEDLLNPRWKGQMMWSTSRGSGAPMFVGTILNTMGNEAGKAYLQKLKLQNVGKTSASNRQVLDLTIAGEYPLALQIFNHHAFISKSAGAPVDWQVHEPATATINNIGLGKFASHPHAAMLLIDFILSEKGQRVYQQSNYLPAHPKVPAKQADLKPGGGRFKRAFYVNPDQQYDKGNDWAEYFENLFMK
ncbi:MAG TPA: ABC transporter substrate-binding protein [Candidatus Binatia bacterium]